VPPIGRLKSPTNTPLRNLATQTGALPRYSADLADVAERLATASGEQLAEIAALLAPGCGLERVRQRRNARRARERAARKSRANN